MEIPKAVLTEQELAAARLAAQGLTANEIAAVMKRSKPTVDRYILVAKAKLNVDKKRHIYQALSERGLLQPAKEVKDDAE